MRIVYSSADAKRIFGIFALSFSLLILLGSCSKKFTPENLPPNQLYFGDGGGFTGKETTYLLLENGQVFMKKPMESNFVELAKMKASRAKKYYKLAGKYEQQKRKQSANAYSFIRYRQDTMHREWVFSLSANPKDSTALKLAEFRENMLNDVMKARKVKTNAKRYLQ